MPKKVLHVGCGTFTKAALKGFEGADWQEVRFDIDPSVNPDIIGTITDMSGVEDESVDAVFSSHNVEHVYPFQVQPTLKEFHRVLRPDGFLVVTCPDLVGICEAVLKVGPMGVLYQSSLGPIRPIDMLYGHMESIAAGNEYMAHKGAFTLDSLVQNLRAAGFMTLVGGRRVEYFDLWMVCFKSEVPTPTAERIASNHLP